MSLQSFLNYLELEKHYSDHTLEAYRKDIEQFDLFVRNELDAVSLQAVTNRMVRKWIISLSEKELARKSINRKLASLKSYYRFLQRVGDIKSSPVAGIKSLKSKSKVQVPFSKQEIEKSLVDLSRANDFRSLRDRTVIELFYTTGIRRSELINILVSDINREEKLIKVLGKRNKQRILPLLDSASATLNQYEEVRAATFPGAGPQLILTDKGMPVYPLFIYRLIKRYFSQVSQKVKTSPHILRHSFATHLLDNGADINSVKELLGHASLGSTQIYTHSSIAHLREVHKASHPRNRNLKP